ncbi:MAG: CPBP family intramembrane metalloprotease [Bacteroidia bacterium]|nr:CPBP family intramembrane metalloprotease [Bacteroidia bacterium]MBT8268507.1 CPBP family intramembrane metalloprotease [Bacteroidia bacterium]
MGSFRINALKFNWQLGLSLILIFGLPRFFLVLQANQTGNYNFTSLIFVLMALTPFILLTRNGRLAIKLKRPKSIGWILISLLLGLAAGILMYMLGKGLYGETISNWYVYISRSYGSLPAGESFESQKLTFFLIFAVIGMTFSPIGEEFLYRGLIHQSFVQRFGKVWASNIDSIAFALVHLAHFGLVFQDRHLKLLLIPAFIWILIMFLTSKMFFLCKEKTGSIWGAVISHAGFNLAMTYFIFYHIL